MSKVIVLDQKRQFRILLHPARQSVLRLLHLAGRPLSASTVARWAELSPLAAKGHLEKLAELGLVDVLRWEGVTGPESVRYVPADVELRLRLGRKDGLQGEREALAAEIADAVFRGSLDAARRGSEEDLGERCLFAFGALHLTRQEREELSALVTDYLAAHSRPAPQSEEHWEYVLIADRFQEE